MAATEQQSAPDPRRWFALVVVSLAVSLIIVDSTIVNVAIPSIVDDLGINSTQVQWVQESYTLVFASLLLVFGTLADRIGRRRMLFFGVIVFTVASIVAALANSGDWLISARVVQGIGGATLLPTTLSLLNATFTGRERGVAFAVWGSTIGGMAAVGPLLGGWLTTDFSWRWAFGINVPIGIIILVGAVIAVRESRAEHPQRVDLVGAVLSVLTFLSLVFGLIEGRTDGWWGVNQRPSFGSWQWPFDLSPVPIAFAVAVLAALAFVLWGFRRERAGRSTMLAFGLLRIPSFRNGSLVALVVSLGEFGIILSLPLWLQSVLGYQAINVGFELVALAVGSFIASGFAAGSSGRIPAVWVVRAGIAFEVIGLVVIGLVISTTTPWWSLALALVVYGFGVGLATAQLTGVVLQDVPISASGQASGMQSTARQIGSALGIAVLGTVLFSSLGSGLDSRLQERPAFSVEAARSGVVNAVVNSSGTAITSLEKRGGAYAEAAADAKVAFSDATRWCAFSAAGALLLGLVASISLGSGVPRRDDAATEAVPSAESDATSGP